MITDQHKVESILANDEYSSDEEVVEVMIESCPSMSAELLRRIVEQERDNFFRDPFHTIHWPHYM